MQNHHNVSAWPEPAELISDPEARFLYRCLRIRLVEERVCEIYPTDKIQSPVHLSIGQEAVAVGVSACLTTKDVLYANYRSHAFYLAKGGDLKAMFAELFGKKTGCGKGKSGSMHLFAPSVGMMLSSAIVASTIPHAVGSGLAMKIKGQAHLAVAVFGDGATEEGVFHESLNFAALRKLPVLFLCENNELAIHSRRSKRQNYEIGALARSYGIRTAEIQNGFDPCEIYRVTKSLTESIRSNEGPAFLEIRTCRYREHVGIGDDFSAQYRSEWEAKWRAQDPLNAQSDFVNRYRERILNEIAEAERFAELSPFPGAEELLADVT